MMRGSEMKLFLAGLLALFMGAAQAADCAYDRTRMLALDFMAFDQDMRGGWRGLDSQACLPQIRDLLHEYREAHKADLSKGHYSLLAWHEGQIRATLGDYLTAEPLLAGWLDDPSPVMRDYAEATIAFLHRDKQALIAARSKLMAEPKPDDFDAQTAGSGYKWPLNLNIVDAFVGCFDKSYAEAYASDACTRLGEKERS